MYVYTLTLYLYNFGGISLQRYSNSKEPQMFLIQNIENQDIHQPHYVHVIGCRGQS